MIKKIKLTNRFDELDSIRGLACLIVVFHHIWMITPVLPNLFSYSPLRALIYGHAAVILFFILSGFVLANQLDNLKSYTYRSFLIKRICRIYIPYLACLALSIFCYNLFSIEGSEKYSNWYSKFWIEEVSVLTLLEHFTLVMDTDTDSLNTVFWSLIHEMRISIFFPLLFYIAKKYQLKTSVLICILLSSLSALNDVYMFSPSKGHLSSYFDTLHYASIFLIGTLVYLKRALLTTYVNQLSSIKVFLYLILGLFLFTYSRVFEILLTVPYAHKFTEYGLCFGSIILIVISLNNNYISNLLKRRVLLFLGKISFSIYLLHFIILVSFVRTWGGQLYMPLIYIFVIITTLVASKYFNQYVEIPSARLGKFLSKRF